MFKQKDTIKFKKVERITLIGQKHSDIKVVHGTLLITFYMISEDGTFITKSRFLRPVFFPKFLQRTVVNLSRPKADRFHRKVLKLDKKLGKKKQD